MSDALKFTDEEIVLLKQLTEKPKWWKNYPFLISVCAFLLSLVTSVISSYNSYQRGIHDQIIEFNSATKNIQELNLKQAEILEKYKGTPTEQIAGLINNQIHNTVTSASDLAIKLGTRASTALLIPISQGLFSYGDYEKPEHIAKIALGSADAVVDQVAALRWMGQLTAVTAQNSTDVSATHFKKGLDIVQQLESSRNPDWIAWLRVAIYLDWAISLVARDCTEARAAFTHAVRVLNTAGRNVDLDLQRDLVRRQVTDGISGNSNCRVPEDAALR